jgi:hypothetical protein
MNLQQLAAVCGLTLAMLLPGCGPGLTGTGTGASQVGLTAFDATEQAVCGAPFASNIGCVASTGAAPSPVNGPVYFESGAGVTLVRAVFDGNVMTISAPCTGFKFEGTWARGAALGDRFYGAQETDGGRTLIAASATVVAFDSGLQITVQDAQAQTLLGPVVLQRQAIAPGAAVCT